MGVNSANKGYIGTNSEPVYGSYSGIESTRYDYYDIPPLDITPYIRPSEWVSIPSITQGEQRFVGTFAVYNHDSNFVAFTVAGNYNVNWGDGTTGSFSSGVAAYKRYDTTTYSGLTSTVFRGYKTLNITITPQSGANITSINLTTKHNQATLSNYVNQWLDIRFSAPNLSSIINMYSDNIPMSMLEQFEWVNMQNTYNFGNQSLFHNCYALQNIVSLPSTKTTNTRFMFRNCRLLQTIPWFDMSASSTAEATFEGCASLRTIPALDTRSLVDTGGMFNGCRSLEYIPWIDTSKSTIFSIMFASCKSLKRIPFLNTNNGTLFNSMFSDCSMLETIPPLNTSKGTNFAAMFRFCRALQSIPQINTSSATTVGSMFDGAHGLRTIPQLDTSNVTNFSYMFYDCYSLESVPLLDTSKGTNFSYMFMFNYSLQSVPAFNLSNGTNFEAMFRICQCLKSLPDFNVSKGTNFNFMLGQIPLLVRAPNLTLGTAGITYSTTAFQNLFNSNTSMVEVPAYNLSGVSFGTAYASVYTNMFASCPSLSIIGITGFNHNIDISGCKLSGTALNELYTSLAVVGASGSATKTITVSNNWGAATDNPNIAIAKGWQVTG